MSKSFVNAHKLSRSRGESVSVHKDYLLGLKGSHPLTGKPHDFTYLGHPFHAEVNLPEGAPEEFADSHRLWGVAESRSVERRLKDAQLATVYEIALPAEDEVTDEDRIALSRRFAQPLVAQGLAVQMVIHAPSDDALEEQQRGGKRANWHLHLMATTRRLGKKATRPGPEGFDELKARDLDPVVRRIGGRGMVTEAENWGEVWRTIQNNYFREMGYETRVDLNGLIPQIHLGPVRTWPAKPGQVKRCEELREANRAATYDVALVLEALTHYNATFTGNELDRFLEKQLGADATTEIALVRAEILNKNNGLVRILDDPATPSGRYSTWAIHAEEQAIIAAAECLSGRSSNPVSARNLEATKLAAHLRPDQEAAFDYAMRAGDLKLITGRAGTGKSYALSAVRRAHEAEGAQVIGLAPTNVVARGMKNDGFSNALTIHSALYQLKSGALKWDRNTVIVVDEATMIATPVLKELMESVASTGGDHGAGPKLILVGDDHQLPSVERGGMFAELLHQYQVEADPDKRPAKITEVVRQKVDWQRQAARALAEYRFKEAVDAFENARAIDWSETPEDAQSALVAAWRADLISRKPLRASGSRAHPQAPGLSEETQFIFAYTNADVNLLNAKVRKVCADEGLLTGPDILFDVCYQAPQPGEEAFIDRVAFAVGDRIQFTRTEKKGAWNREGGAEPIFNGALGTITHINSETGEITAQVDGADGQKTHISWKAKLACAPQDGDLVFDGFRHAYAGTIYKGQGATLDRAYVYHSEHMTAASSYVALTRQRKQAKIFVSRTVAGDTDRLADQMARRYVSSASVHWLTQGGGTGDSGMNIEAQASPVLAGARNQEGVSAPMPSGGDALTGMMNPRMFSRMQPNREMQHASVERLKARGLVREWNKRANVYWAALSTPEPNPADQAKARAALRELVQSLHGMNRQPNLAHMLKDLVGEIANREGRRTLLLLINHHKPVEAFDRIAAALERRRPRTPLLELPHDTRGMRPRSRNRGVR